MASKKGGLGRGLDALMTEADIEEKKTSAKIEKQTDKKTERTEKKSSARTSLPAGLEADESGTLWVDPHLLKPNPHQPRKIFNDEDLQDLAASIKEHGIIQMPVIEDAGDGTFYIILGERRTRASIIAGLSKIPVQLRKFSDEKKLEIALIENIQRTDLNPIEEAQAYFDLMQLGGFNQEEVAQKVGKKRSTVANALRLLKLPEDMQASLVSGQITAGHARALLSVISPADQRILFGKIIGASMSVRDAEAAASELNNGGRAAKTDSGKEKTASRDSDIVELEQQFISALGTKVTVKGNLSHGSLVIDYFSREDLDRLYAIFTKN